MRQPVGERWISTQPAPFTASFATILFTPELKKWPQSPRNECRLVCPVFDKSFFGGGGFVGGGGCAGGGGFVGGGCAGGGRAGGGGCAGGIGCADRTRGCPRHVVKNRVRVGTNAAKHGEVVAAFKHVDRVDLQHSEPVNDARNRPTIW